MSERTSNVQQSNSGSSTRHTPTGGIDGTQLSEQEATLEQLTEELNERVAENSSVPFSAISGFSMETVMTDENGPTNEAPVKLQSSTVTVANMADYLSSSSLSISSHLGSDEHSFDTVTNKSKAVKLASVLFTRIKMPMSEHIEERDVHDFLPAKEAVRTFERLDRRGNGFVSRLDVKKFIIGVFKRRGTLTQILTDTSVALDQLQTFLWLLMAPTVELLMLLYLSGTETGDYWVIFPTALLGISYISAPAIQRTVDGIVLVFLRSPYDANDIIRVSSMPDVLLKVTEVHLLQTTFQLHLGGGRVVLDNSQLLLDVVTNITHGDNIWKKICFCVDLTFSNESFHLLDEAIRSLVQSDPAEFEEHVLLLANAPNGTELKVTLSLWVRLRHSGGGLTRTNSAMNRLMRHAVSTLCDIGVSFTTPDGTMTTHSGVINDKRSGGLFVQRQRTPMVLREDL